MGLDVSAYSNAVYLRPLPQDGDYDYEKGERAVYKLEDLPEQTADLAEGIYLTGGSLLGFRAGSYSGYNTWRAWLASLVQVTPKQVWAEPEHYKELPFYLLINFSDCEGIIGPRCSAMLARDFAKFQEQADACGSEWDREKYAYWRRAFEIAAEGGFVQFH